MSKLISLYSMSDIKMWHFFQPLIPLLYQPQKKSCLSHKGFCNRCGASSFRKQSHDNDENAESNKILHFTVFQSKKQALNIWGIIFNYVGNKKEKKVMKFQSKPAISILRPLLDNMVLCMTELRLIITTTWDIC